MSQPRLVSTFVSLGIIPSNLEHVCQRSLDILDNASSHQINAAVKYNQNEINKLLIQLLTVNYISKNQKTIGNETKKLNLDDKNNNNNDFTKQLTNYCSGKLLEISPIQGFSPKVYFLEYKISDDIQMEILTYLKPIQLFKSITLVNKQFNKNVSTMHESTNSKYMSLFDTSNFTFNSFLEMAEYCNNGKLQVSVDYEISIASFFSGTVTGLDSVKQCASITAMISGLGGTTNLHFSNVAPYKSLTHHPCNKNRFKDTIIKRGYYNETCDINISKFCDMLRNSDTNNDERFDFVRGFVGPATNEIATTPDCWVCGKINFDYTLSNAVSYTREKIKGLMDATNDVYDANKYDQIRPALEKCFDLFQIFIDVDITQYYNKYTAAERKAIHARFSHYLSTVNDKKVLVIATHGDDRTRYSYFGDKSSVENRKQITTSGFCHVEISESKQKFLDLIGYPNYCPPGPSGCICRINNEKAFEMWCQTCEKCDISLNLFDAGIMKRRIDTSIIDKVYYDEDKDELRIKKLYTHATIMVIDSNAPAPLKNTYPIVIGSEQRPRLIDAVITEPGLIDIDYDAYVCDESEENMVKIDKRKVYFDRLEKWQGCFQCTFDITD